MFVHLKINHHKWSGSHKLPRHPVRTQRNEHLENTLWAGMMATYWFIFVMFIFPGADDILEASARYVNPYLFYLDLEKAIPCSLRSILPAMLSWHALTNIT